MPRVDIDTHGPIFVPGLPEAVMKRGVREVEEKVAEEGARMVRSNLNKVLRNQTGHYRSRVKAERGVIHDSRMIYGPWLEGTGSRNSPKTRFPGYATFRRTTGEIQARSGQIGDRAIAPYVRRLN
jgi:hypothetical protein